MTLKELQKYQKHQKLIRCKTCDFKQVRKTSKSQTKKGYQFYIYYECSIRQNEHQKLKQLKIGTEDIACCLHQSFQKLQLEI